LEKNEKENKGNGTTIRFYLDFDTPRGPPLSRLLDGACSVPSYQSRRGVFSRIAEY
jgi:hypothetical protein